MPSPFQQQARQRKILYTVLIVALFTVSLFFRRAETYGVEAQANNLEIRQENLGDVELTGSAIRLMLSGSRGLVVCGLWWGAQEKQKKHEWNELELLVRSVTKLQPHFITPWLFQSWNLAYNVAVESDQVKDKYFYISRGTELLAEGERQNRNNPDLRFTLGFYQQHKIGLSDEQNTLRCLFQMSCIPPALRDPNRLRVQSESTGRPQVDLVQFEQFCKRYPMLVRRLREMLRCETPEDVVDFLAANQKIPHRYEDGPVAGAAVFGGAEGVLKPAEQQFPILPPKFDRDEYGPAEDLPYDADNFTVARAWFGYSQLPLPPPEPKPVMTVQYDRTKYRMPRYMASHIFRGYPARAQTFIAEYLEKEGWFDGEGWLIRGWFPDDKFTSEGRTDAVVGANRDWAVRAWTRAYEMWRDHGQKNGLYLTPEHLRNLDERAQLFRTTFSLQPHMQPFDVPPSMQTPELLDSADAYAQLYWYDVNRNMTNFAHFFHQTQVEMTPEAVKARKAFFQADQMRRAGRRDLALQKYAEGLPTWRDLLLANREFRRDSIIQEDSYEVEVRYLELMRELYGRRFKTMLLLTDALGQTAARSPATWLWLPPGQLVRTVPVPIGSPFDVKTDDGQPLIAEDAKERVRSRMGLTQPGTRPSQPPTETPAPVPSTPVATPG